MSVMVRVLVVVWVWSSWGRDELSLKKWTVGMGYP
jgi:hypothetical protein